MCRRKKRKMKIGEALVGMKSRGSQLQHISVLVEAPKRSHYQLTSLNRTFLLERFDALGVVVATIEADGGGYLKPPGLRSAVSAEDEVDLFFSSLWRRISAKFARRASFEGISR